MRRRAVHVKTLRPRGELIDFFADGKPEPEKIAPIAARYGLELDPSTIPALCAEHGLKFG